MMDNTETAWIQNEKTPAFSHENHPSRMFFSAKNQEKTLKRAEEKASAVSIFPSVPAQSHSPVYCISAIFPNILIHRHFLKLATRIVIFRGAFHQNFMSQKHIALHLTVDNHFF